MYVDVFQLIASWPLICYARGPPKFASLYLVLESFYYLHFELNWPRCFPAITFWIWDAIVVWLNHLKQRCNFPFLCKFVGVLFLSEYKFKPQGHAIWKTISHIIFLTACRGGSGCLIFLQFWHLGTTLFTWLWLLLFYYFFFFFWLMAV